MAWVTKSFEGDGGPRRAGAVIGQGEGEPHPRLHQVDHDQAQGQDSCQWRLSMNHPRGLDADAAWCGCHLSGDTDHSVVNTRGR